jgi:hypothetical protein
MEERCNPPSSEDASSLLEDLKKGVNARDVSVSFHDFSLTATHPNPPSDATAEIHEKGASSDLHQMTNHVHPSALIIFNVINGSPANCLASQGNLDNGMVQRGASPAGTGL